MVAEFFKATQSPTPDCAIWWTEPEATEEREGDEVLVEGVDDAGDEDVDPKG